MNLRKIIGLLLTVFVLCASISAYAAPCDVIVNADLDSVGGGILVSGTVNTARTNLSLMLTIKDESSKVVYVDQMYLPRSKERPVPYTFPAASIYLGNASGTYTVEVTAEYFGTGTDTYEFYGSDKLYDALDALIDAIASGDENAVADVCINKANDLGIKASSYTLLGEYGQATVKDLISQKNYTIPAGYSTDSDINSITATAETFRDDWNEAVMIGDFNDIASAAEATAWIALYGAEFSADDAETADVDESKLYAYVQTVKGETIYGRRLGNHTALRASDAVADILYQEALLTVIEAYHYSEGKKVFDAFPTVFDIDTDAFSKLEVGEAAKVYENVPGVYDTCIKAGDEFDRLVELYGGGDSDDDDDYRGTGPNSYVGSAKAVKDEISTEQLCFPDMGVAKWAETAVKTLKEEGVINGDNAGLFNPNNNVTRAEFIKMVLLAKGYAPSMKDAEFKDVFESEWYFGYVNSAKENGLIQGSDNGCFYPQRSITRQDMAVILYRAFGIKNQNYSLTFADRDLVSDYAKEAVAYFSAKGIVSGIGGNLFAPVDNATRAEAAQIIYNAIYK